MNLTNDLLEKMSEEILPLSGNSNSESKGSKENPYSEKEYESMIASGTLKSGVYYKTEDGSITYGLPVIECTPETSEFVLECMSTYNDHKPSGYWAMMAQMYSLQPTTEPLIISSDKEENVENMNVANDNPYKEDNEKGVDFICTLAGFMATSIEGTADLLTKVTEPLVKMKMYLPMQILREKKKIEIIGKRAGSASVIETGVSLGYLACTGDFDNFIKNAAMAGVIMELSFYFPATWVVGLAIGGVLIWSEMKESNN